MCGNGQHSVGAGRVSTLTQCGFTQDQLSSCSTDHRTTESLTLFLLITSSTPWWKLSYHFAFPDGMMQRGPLGTVKIARAWTQAQGKPVDKMWKGLINTWEILKCQNHSCRAVPLEECCLGCALSPCWDTSGRCAPDPPGAAVAKTCCFWKAKSWWKGRDFSSRTTRASVSVTQPLLLCWVTRARLNLSIYSFFICGWL